MKMLAKNITKLLRKIRVDLRDCSQIKTIKNSGLAQHLAMAELTMGGIISILR